MQLGGRNAVLRQVLGELLGLELGAGEQDAAAFARGEHAHEFVLVAARGFEHVVGHQVGFGGGRIDLVHLGIVQEGVHHFIHAVIERGGEQHVLGVGRNLLKQSLDRWQEAHIGHFVGLIDDHDFDGRERERLLAQQVLKAARAGDHDIGAGLQIADLVDVLDAAVHRGGVHAKRVGQRHQHVVDLVRELAGGGQHQAARVRQEVVGAALFQAGLLAALDFLAELLHRDFAERIVGIGQGVGLNGECGLLVICRKHAHQRSGYAKFAKGKGAGFRAVVHLEISGIVTIIEIITGHSGLSCQRLRKLRKLSELSVSPLLCLVLATLSSHSLLMTPWGGNSPMGRQLAHGAV